MENLRAVFVSVVWLLAVSNSNTQTLIPELKYFEEIANQNWIGRFDDTGETSEIRLNIEIILDGAAILETNCIPASGNFCSQTLYYWDPQAKTIAAIRVTNNRWLFRFTVTPKDSVLLCEGTRCDPEGNVSKVTSERIVHSDGSIRDNKGKRDSRIYRKNQTLR